MQLVFATHNPNKIEEIRPLLPSSFQLVTLQSLGCTTDIPETGATLEKNALLKAQYVSRNYGLPCFADDTGLLVDALNGAPGIHSARYAGKKRNASDNMNKLLRALGDTQFRSARFETVIALVLNGGQQLFKGVVHGKIAHERSGKGGFGYDPIFIPEGYKRSFAELPLEKKNQISHRSRAFQKLITYLESLSNTGLKG